MGTVSEPSLASVFQRDLFFWFSSGHFLLILKMKRGDEKLNLNKTNLPAHRSLRRKRGGGGGGGTAEALRVGDAARNPSPAESVPSGTPPPHAPTCKVWTNRGGRRWEGEARKRGGGRVCR